MYGQITSNKKRETATPSATVTIRLRMQA